MEKRANEKFFQKVDKEHNDYNTLNYICSYTTGWYRGTVVKEKMIKKKEVGTRKENPTHTL